MKILVTGANGYIGSHVVRLLLDRGEDVIACDVSSDRIDKRASYCNLNILNSSCFTNPDIFGTPDVCLHLAWRDGFNHDSDKHLLDLSIHYNFLTHLMSNGLKQLVVMGTMHEVGYYEGMIDENTPCNPLSMYGIAKDALRRSISLYASKTQCVLQWLRGFYIYGDDLMNHSIFTKLIEADRRGEKEFPFNSGKNKYDFIHINDLVNQIVLVLSQKDVSGVINCCSGIPVRLADKTESFIEENNLHVKLKYGAFPDRPYDSPCIYGDASKINQIISRSR